MLVYNYPDITVKDTIKMTRYDLEFPNSLEGTKNLYRYCDERFGKDGYFTSDVIRLSTSINVISIYVYS